MGNQRFEITNIFFDKNILFRSMVESIIEELKDVIIRRGEATMLLSGDSTPGPLYKLLDEECAFLEKIKIGLVDERYVPVSSEFSNEKYIKNCFSKHPEAFYQITGMVIDSEDEKKNIDHVNSKYQDFLNQTDIVILGMGTDGHIASIFPEDKESLRALLTSEKTILKTKAPSKPSHRITCSMKMITEATSIYMLFHGNEKRKVLHDKTQSLPIHDLLEKRKDVKIFYLDDDK